LRRLLLAFVLLAAVPAPTAAAEKAVRLHPVARGLRFPVLATAPRGDRHDLYVAERRGRVLLFRHGKRRRRAFLDVRSAVSKPVGGGENGFLSLAFAPHSRLLYVSYSTRRGTERVEEWRANRSRTHVVAGSRRTLLDLPHPDLHHYGGDLHFGPDGHLYVSVGDGGEGQGANAQDLSNLYGKILRIDPRPSGYLPYSIPPGNPFAARPEIWLYGVRNPWRFSFAPGGDLVIGEVGEQQREEVDWLADGRGVNLGWPCREGSIPFSGCTAADALDPSFEYSHFDQNHPPRPRPGTRIRRPAPGHRAPEMPGGCTGAVTGGYVVRGAYTFGDYCAGMLYRAHRNGSGRLTVRALRRFPRFGLVSFGQDGRGRLLTVDTLDGRVDRLLPERR
jgi:glucose/arabinose dehydrogenase